MNRFNNMPDGNYNKTSRLIKVILKAKCERIDKSYNEGILDITNSFNPYIENLDGELTVTRKGKKEDVCAFKGEYLPFGNFHFSSRGISISLTAECQNLAGKYVTASLNLEGYDPLIDYIANVDGVLQIFPLFGCLPSLNKLNETQIDLKELGGRRVLATVKNGEIWNILKNCCFALKFYISAVGAGSEGYDERIKLTRDAFEAWNRVKDLSIGFIETNVRNEAHIRITFLDTQTDHVVKVDKETRNYLFDFTGLKPLHTHINNMNLGMRKGLGNEGYVTALHEIGHVLGFVHEFCRPDLDVQYDWNQVYVFFSNRNPVPINVFDNDPPTSRLNDIVYLYRGKGFDKEKLQIKTKGNFNKYLIHSQLQVEQDILVAFRKKYLFLLEEIKFDPKSVMNYNMPAACFTAPEFLRNNGISRSNELTENDKLTAQYFYPLINDL